MSGHWTKYCTSPKSFIKTLGTFEKNYLFFTKNCNLFFIIGGVQQFIMHCLIPVCLCDNPDRTHGQVGMPPFKLMRVKGRKGREIRLLLTPILLIYQFNPSIIYFFKIVA